MNVSANSILTIENFQVTNNTVFHIMEGGWQVVAYSLLVIYAFSKNVEESGVAGRMSYHMRD